jgi:lambda family phage portal protein
MSWLSKFKRTEESPAQAVPSVRPRWQPFRLARAWKAAKQDRLTADWLSNGGDINQELKSQLSIIRMRAREQEQNSNLARSFLSLVETHVVGPDGFTLQVQGKLRGDKADTAGNRRVEREYRAWSRRGVCEVTGRYSRHAAERVSVRTTARDGECLIRLHDVQPSHRNPWGFVIELLDPARLDHMLNTDLKNGNRVRMGIELNPAGRAVAYWLKTGERRGWVYIRDEHERVPADDIIHWFEADRPEQLRGVSWLASAMLNIHQLSQYIETAIVAARYGASKMGWVVDKEGNGHAMDEADEVDDSGDLIEEIEAGTIGHLSGDKTFIGFDPKYPHENFEPFTKTLKKDMAMGIGASYHGLTGDLTDVNFSSIRSGTLEERERWKVKQDSFSGTVCERIYLRWLDNAVFHGRLGRVVSQEELIDRYSEHRHQGRRWEWVDPFKDIKAVIEAINARLLSPQMAAAQLGRDVEDVLQQIAEFEAMAKEKGVSLAAPKQAAEAAPAKPQEEEADDADANAKD